MKALRPRGPATSSIIARSSAGRVMLVRTRAMSPASEVCMVVCNRITLPLWLNPAQPPRGALVCLSGYLR